MPPEDTTEPNRLAPGSPADPNITFVEGTDAEIAEALLAAKADNEVEAGKTTTPPLPPLIGIVDTAAAIKIVMRQRKMVGKGEALAWKEKLTPEEKKLYDEIGFYLQLLQTLMRHDRLIAMPGEKVGDAAKKENLAPGEKASEAQFSWKEFIKMMESVRDDIKKFLGQELNRENTPSLKAFVNGYRMLQRLHADMEEYDRAKTNGDSDKSTFDVIFKKIIEKLPAEFVKLMIKRENDKEGRAILLGATVKNLGLGNKDEEEQLQNGEKNRAQKQREKQETLLLQAAAIIRPLFAKTFKTAGGAAAKPKSHIETAEIAEVIETLGKVECLRRVNSEGEKNMGIRELHEILNLLSSWETVFLRIENTFKGEQREIIKPLANAAARHFPDNVAPAVAMNHREIIDGRMAPYRKLQQIFAEHADPEVAKIISQIGILLCYLDFIWGMHEVTEGRSGKNIKYPERMLVPARIVALGVERLIASMTKIAYKKIGADKETTDLDLAFSDEEPIGVTLGPDDSNPGVRYEDLKPKPANPDNIREAVSAEVEDVDQAMEKAMMPPPKKQSERELGEKIDTIAFALGMGLDKAKQALENARVRNIASRRKKGPNGRVEASTGLHQVQDFISTLQENLLDTLCRIGQIYEPGLASNTAIPEFAEYETQAATLRIHLSRLGEKVEKVGQTFDGLSEPQMEIDCDDNETSLKAAKQHTTDAKVAIGMALIELDQAIEKFQNQQNQDIGAKKYYGVLTGGDYEIVNQFVTTLKNFFINQDSADIKESSVNTWQLSRTLAEFIEKTNKLKAGKALPNNGALGQCLRQYEELSKIDIRTAETPDNGLSLIDREEQYRVAVCQIFGKLEGIATGEIADTDPEKRAQEHCKAFVKKYPAIRKINGNDLDKGFFKLMKLMKQFEDFRSLFGMSKKIGNERFVADHDRHLAQNVIGKIDFIVSQIGFNDFTTSAPDSLYEAMEVCQSSIEHLQLLDPELTVNLHETLRKLSECLNFMREYSVKVDPEIVERLSTDFRKIQKDLTSHFQLLNSMRPQA